MLCQYTCRELPGLSLEERLRLMFHCVRWQCLSRADWTRNLCLCFLAKFYPRPPTASGSPSSCLTESGSLTLSSPAPRNLIDSDRDTKRLEESCQASGSQKACRVNSGKCHVLVACLGQLGHAPCQTHWGITSNWFYLYVLIIRKLFLRCLPSLESEGLSWRALSDETGDPVHSSLNGEGHVLDHLTGKLQASLALGLHEVIGTWFLSISSLYLLLGWLSF